MNVIRSRDIRPEQGDAGRFEGDVVLERMISGPGDVSVSVVHFRDGARTHWHVHPGEQILVVLQGECQIATEGGEDERVEEGAVIHVPPGEKHWHGAAPGGSMTHMSITTGGSPTWLGPAPPR